MKHDKTVIRAVANQIGMRIRSIQQRKMISTTTVALAIGMSAMADAAQQCELIKDINFNNRSGSYQVYTQAMATDDFGTLEKNAAGDVRGLDRPGTTWHARNAVGNGVLRVNYPANIAGGVKTGILFDQKFASTEEAVMEYRLKFDSNFKWAYGGKLPGLAGSEGQIPVGCTQDVNRIKNGFSARLMWRRNGKLVVYSYFPNRLEPYQGNCGIDYEFATVDVNKWYTVRQYIKLNTPGQNNGILRMEIDGQVGLDMRDVEYRLAGKDNVKINDFLFHTYRGGGETDERFHSPTNDYIYMDDFKVWTNCSNPDTVVPPPSSGADDLSCTVAASDISSAQSKFANQCSGFTRADCDVNTVNGQSWAICSSRTLDDSFKLPNLSSSGTLTLQAEDYARAVDSSAGNQGGEYRQGDVDIQSTSDSGGGYNVGWVSAGETLEYDVLVTQAQSYQLELRTASTRDTGLISIDVDGDTRVSNRSINYTGDFQSYQTQMFDLGTLSKGSHSITLQLHNGPFNINWLRLSPNGTAPTEPTEPTEPPTQTTCLTYSGSDKVELNLSQTQCVNLPANLSGKTLSVWDSDTNAQCDFRGSVTSVNGSGALNVTANYVTTTAMTGTVIKFDSNNQCSFVKMRVY